MRLHFQAQAAMFFVIIALWTLAWYHHKVSQQKHPECWTVKGTPEMQRMYANVIRTETTKFGFRSSHGDDVNNGIDDADDVDSSWWSW